MHTNERDSAPMAIVEEDGIQSNPRPLRATIMTEVPIPPVPVVILTTKRLEASTRFCFCDSRYEIQGIKQTAMI